MRSVLQTGSSTFCLDRRVTVSAKVSREPRVQEGEADQVDDQEAGQRPSVQVTVWTTAREGPQCVFRLWHMVFCAARG